MSCVRGASERTSSKILVLCATLFAMLNAHCLNIHHCLWFKYIREYIPFGYEFLNQIVKRDSIHISHHYFKRTAICWACMWPSGGMMASTRLTTDAQSSYLQHKQCTNKLQLPSSSFRTLSSLLPLLHPKHATLLLPPCLPLG